MVLPPVSTKHSLCRKLVHVKRARYSEASDSARTRSPARTSVQRRRRRSGSLDSTLKPVDQRPLRFDDLRACVRDREPFDPVDLGKAGHQPRVRRPFELEGVAARVVRVDVGLDSEAMNHLAASLPNRPKASSANSRRAAAAGASLPGSNSPLGIDHAPSSLRDQKGPPGCASRTSSPETPVRYASIPALWVAMAIFAG
jgi:hypothetical protein